ncbi:platelet endothelial aggregation receptor 1-like [Chironomus tepperi]|uniref:platelet endothelial aggregation receptor 1-like n=1 Tax=Chironomus tepperi TaxID=113505 RepID=UPI00391F6BD1
MKKFVLFLLIVSLFNGLSSASDSPCLNQPNGTHLPINSDCSKFILCDSNLSLTLSCRSSAPYFDRCNDICVDDMSVCAIRECPGVPPPTVPTVETEGPTDAPTDPPTEPENPTDPVGVVPNATTTFRPPTVPTMCPTACDASTLPADCACVEKWTCNWSTKQCVCDANKQCPMTRAQCEADADCGCARRCECDDAGLVCTCNKDIQCPFADVNGQCINECGCQKNCDCTSDPNGCVCNATCGCIEPPLRCPFAPGMCGDRCGCASRCICNGLVCYCDPENGCAA